MTGIGDDDVSGLLQAWSAGDAAARDKLIGVLYQDLWRRAAGRLACEQGAARAWPNTRPKGKRSP